MGSNTPSPSPTHPVREWNYTSWLFLAICESFSAIPEHVLVTPRRAATKFFERKRAGRKGLNISMNTPFGLGPSTSVVPPKQRLALHGAARPTVSLQLFRGTPEAWSFRAALRAFGSVGSREGQSQSRSARSILTTKLAPNKSTRILQPKRQLTPHTAYAFWPDARLPEYRWTTTLPILKNYPESFLLDTCRELEEIPDFLTNSRYRTSFL